jgi:hypothetical protein
LDNIVYINGESMKQITVISEDQVGRLAEISFLLGRSKINIDAISVGKVGSTGIVNLTVKHEDKALHVLQANGFKCLKSDILVVKLVNEPGELAKMTKRLSDNKVSLENLTVITQGPKYSVYSLQVDKHAKAEKLLKDYLDIERV